MNMKKWVAGAAALCLMLGLTACDSAPKVYVQSVSKLMSYEGIAPGDRFGGMVVSEFVAEIQKDSDKGVAELMVQEGDDVKEGDPLFSYDTEELQLALDKQKLELEQMKASIENYKTQIEKLEKEINRVSGNTKLQYSIQIQSTQVELKETEIKIKGKEAEVKKSQDILEHSTVTAPVTGRVQAINESGTGPDGETAPYITIQKTGAYRIKGILGELQLGSITEGSRIQITSRTDPEAKWYGTVSLVDLENPIRDDNGGMMMMGPGGGEEMAAASRYPFYVKLDTTEGLLMGQHVYLQLDAGEGELFEVAVDGAFLNREEDGSAWVWAESSHGKLEKRPVELGGYNEMMDLYEITGGITGEDYIAFPDASCQEGAKTSHEPVEQLPGEEGENPEDAGAADDGIMTDDLPEMPAEMPAQAEGGV